MSRGFTGFAVFLLVDHDCRGARRSEADMEKDGLQQTLQMLQKELGDQNASLSEVNRVSKRMAFNILAGACTPKLCRR